MRCLHLCAALWRPFLHHCLKKARNQVLHKLHVQIILQRTSLNQHACTHDPSFALQTLHASFERMPASKEPKEKTSAIYHPPFLIITFLLSCFPGTEMGLPLDSTRILGMLNSVLHSIYLTILWNSHEYLVPSVYE